MPSVAPSNTSQYPSCASEEVRQFNTADLACSRSSKRRMDLVRRCLLLKTCLCFMIGGLLANDHDRSPSRLAWENFRHCGVKPRRWSDCLACGSPSAAALRYQSTPCCWFLTTPSPFSYMTPRSYIALGLPPCAALRYQPRACWLSLGTPLPFSYMLPRFAIATT